MAGEPANWICVTCGAQFAASAEPPAECGVCTDERQYVGMGGQRWTTQAELRDQGRRNEWREYEPGLTGFGTAPSFAIGQRALLVETPAGNVLWDCISYLDDATIAEVRRRGGIDTIAISHPHFYTGMVDWADAFDARILLPAADRRWVMRPSEQMTFWEGDRFELLGGLSVHRLGCHFEGSGVLHWPSGAERRGALLTGDTVQVVADRRWVSFMRSYPNQIPLAARKVRRIAATATALEFDRIYGGWWDSIVASDARAAVERSAERYVKALESGGP